MMKPHFVFNSLNSILSLIKTNRSKEAEKYIGAFAKLLRNTLEGTTQLSVPLNKEVDRLEAYLSIEKMRHNFAFEYDIRVADDLSLEDLRVPPMIIQPFVENSIKHGLVDQMVDGTGFIVIEFNIEHDTLAITITDNGIGYSRQKAKTSSNEYRSMGLQLIEDMLTLMNKLTQKGHHVIIGQTENSKGTQVLIQIPVANTHHGLPD